MHHKSDFDYIRKVASKYGKLYVAEEFKAFLDNLNDEQLDELKSVYEMLESKDDSLRISRWISRCFDPKSGAKKHEIAFARQVGQILLLFEHLGEKGMSPFSSYEVGFIRDFKKPNWHNLPDELKYLIDVAEVYGIHHTEEDILTFLDNAHSRDLKLLKQTAQRIRLGDHMQMIQKWLMRFPLDEHEEASLVYFLLLLMDHAGLV